ncbi:hypothetical protein KM043_006986 [Ampulex compressa]|nr:hypothetical protein KM043_006986 [Ampulex compressa]
MYRTEFVIPWVIMRAREEHMRKEIARLSVLEPFAPPFSITYFNNRKRERRIAEEMTAYDRIHASKDFDPKKPRCDRTKPRLLWAGIHEENKGHTVPMTANHWYGWPNRTQVDHLEKKFNRSSKTREFYSRNAFNLNACQNRGDIKIC